ncbi:MAG: outer membrane beta-barrel protein [Rhizobiales bacterium]|nr:outer membrane beta-barrel protein [Hyphomicrobiales bacterium]
MWNGLIRNTLLGTRGADIRREARTVGTGGNGVPRLRLSPLPHALRVGALLAYLVGSAGALAESALFSPRFDGDPQWFRRSIVLPKGPRTEILPTSTFQPASGAGNTGFDSSGKRKAKGKDKSKAGEKVPLPSRYGSPEGNPLAPTRLAVPRLPIGVERKGASPYYVGPEIIITELPVRRRVLPDEAPFDPTGIQVGAFNFKPAIELTGGYDTNPARTQNATPSWYSVVAPELKFNSNWDRHEFTGDLRGSYYTYEELPSQNRPNVDSKLTGRVDVTRDTRIDLETKFLIGTDNPGSPNIQAGLARLPIFTTWGGTAGLGHRFNRFDIATKGGAERTVYQDSTFTDGTTASNEDRNYNRYNLQLRGSYEVSPATKPFMEVGTDRRVHDLDVDFSGLRRNSVGGYVKAGTTFEFTRIITGDIAVGWLERHYEDPTLQKLAGLTIDGSLTWVASALTTAKLIATTRADESRVFGVSGVFTREVTLQIDHAFRRWLLATFKVLYGNDDYVGSNRDDNRYSVSAAITYKLTRDLWLKSEYRHEWLRSSEPGSNYNADVFLVGLRAQR